MTSLSDRRTQLTDRLAELTEHLHKIENALDETPNRDAEDRATEREGDEVLEGLGAVELREARMIQAALRRLDEGSYGSCVKCGEQISEKRLNLLPSTPYCRNCAN